MELCHPESGPHDAETATPVPGFPMQSGPFLLEGAGATHVQFIGTTTTRGPIVASASPET